MDELNAGEVLKTSTAFLKEEDKGKIFSLFMEAAIELTNCDGAVIFSKYDDEWKTELLTVKSKGLTQEQLDSNKCAVLNINLPAVKRTQEQLVALPRHPVNISDLNLCQTRASGWKKFDDSIGYHTVSMLVVPMIGEKQDTGENIVGMLYLLNALDHNGHIIAFNKDVETTLFSLATQAAIRCSNLNDAVKIHELFDSFVRVMSTGIDARTPYNANHTKNMVKYAERFIQWLNQTENEWHFTEKQERQFIMCVWLHDIGKLAIPSEVMDKSNRLGSKIERILYRFKEICLLDEIRVLRGEMTKENQEERNKLLKGAVEVIQVVNQIGFLSDEMLQHVKAIAQLTYINAEGTECNWLKQDELEALSVRKGTLTKQEREVMESHVLLTTKMLNEIDFNADYANVAVWAGQHHEFLNGEGYPNGLTAEQIPKEVRLLTILDIFDALTAHDRPYKMPTPCSNAFHILKNMAEQGQIDGEILDLFYKSEAWLDEN